MSTNKTQKILDEALSMLEQAATDYWGMAGTLQNYGLKASAKEAEETATHIASFLSRAGRELA